MAKVRRSLWVTAVVCGVLLIFLVTFLGHQGRNGEKVRVEQKEEAEIQRGGSKQQDEGMTEEGEEKALSSQERLDTRSGRGVKQRGRLLGAAELDLSREPKLGEIVKLTFTFTAGEDLPRLKIVFDVREGIEIVGGTGITYTSMQKGEAKSFSADLRFLSSPAFVVAKAVRYGYTGEGKEKDGLQKGRGLRRVIIDEETGQFGTETDYVQLHPECWRTPLSVEEGPWFGVENMRKDMSRFLEEAPGLTKLEARWLVDKAEWLGRVNPEEGKNWLERRREFIDEIITDAKNKAKKGRVSLLEVFRNMIEDWKKTRPEENLMVPEPLDEEGVPIDDSYLYPGSNATVTVRGLFKYKKHQYNKEIGLDTTTISVPIGKAMVWVWENAPSPTYLGKCLTDEDGYYEKTVTTSGPGPEYHVWTVVHTTGPRYSAPEAYMIKVICDTTTQYPSSPPAPFWRFRTDPLPTPNGGIADFGVWFVGERYGLYPAKHQPRSGAAAIYDVFLKAYEYTKQYSTPDSIGRALAKWDLGFTPDDTISYYDPDGDTISILGLDYHDTDEWDDLVLVHEYGHHVMHNCAELPSYQIPPDGWVWHVNYTDTIYRNLAYAEGWASLFASIATESIYYVDTYGGIGGGDAYYDNVENPWEFSDNVPPDTFQGGPWCPGAVTGSLWDVYDSIDELPYPAPDTNLADTVRLGFDEIWAVFDSCDPPPLDSPPNNCWTIRHFISGWRSPEFNYNHEVGVQQICEHHRIEWDFGPNPPKNLRDRVVPQKLEVELQYGPPDTYELATSSPPAAGYCIYRKQAGDTLFSRLATPTDTFWVDSTVEANQKYIYTATAYDTLWNEGDTSNNVTIWVPGSEDSLATAYNNAQKIAWAEKDSTVYVAFSSGDSVYCEISTNFGDNWLKTSVGEGAFPTIALAPDGDLWMVWLGDYGWGIDSLFLAYRSVLCAQYSAGSWSEYDTIHTYKGNDSLQCVSFSADSLGATGYGHVVATYMQDNMHIEGTDTIHCIESYLEYFRFVLDDSLSNLKRQVVSSASVGTPPPLITLATVDADTVGDPHIAWERLQSLVPGITFLHFGLGLALIPAFARLSDECVLEPGTNLPILFTFCRSSRWRHLSKTQQRSACPHGIRAPPLIRGFKLTGQCTVCIIISN